MMYGFGDVRDPLPTSVALMEEMTIDFITDLCMRARPSSSAVPQTSSTYPPTARVKVKVDDFKHALRKDPKKLARLEELLYLDAVIKRERKSFDVETMAKEVDVSADVASGFKMAARTGAGAAAGGSSGQPPEKRARTEGSVGWGAGDGSGAQSGASRGPGANRGRGKGWRKGMGKKGAKAANAGSP